MTIAVFALLLIAMIAGIARRIHTLHGAVERYSHRLGVSVPRLNTGDPIASLATRLERLSEEIIAETYMLEYQARHDSLTSLPNRALLLSHLAPHGVVVVNFPTRQELEASALRAEPRIRACFASAFRLSTAQNDNAVGAFCRAPATPRQSVFQGRGGKSGQQRVPYFRKGRCP